MWGRGNERHQIIWLALFLRPNWRPPNLRRNVWGVMNDTAYRRGLLKGMWPRTVQYPHCARYFQRKFPWPFEWPWFISTSRAITLATLIIPDKASRSMIKGKWLHTPVAIMTSCSEMWKMIWPVLRQNSSSHDFQNTAAEGVSEIYRCTHVGSTTVQTLLQRVPGVLQTV
jgi:hypothetical protein